ncbi:MAG: HAD-IC family P-type ATPase [archaeon]|nr:HAD-IC family P-type ATPase [archaeon]
MAITGLTSKEVTERISKGEINSVKPIVSSSYRDIIARNACNSFNLILLIMGITLWFISGPMDGLAATLIIALNIIVATIQEIRAKRRLDKIALLMRPTTTVIRDGKEKFIDQSEIVKDDIIKLSPGDQAPVDGQLIAREYLEMDESLLTGESSTVMKHDNDRIYSGSYCVTGTGFYKVDAFGINTFASKMLASAKKYTNKMTPLQMEISAITKLLMSIAFVILFVMIIVNVVKGRDINIAFQNTVKNAVIVLGIVPIALFLLIVINYMVAAVRMADKGILLQRSNAVESLSHVDTICMDKTGTITTNRLLFNDMVSFIDEEESKKLIKLYASSTGSVNSSIEALRKKFGIAEKVRVIEEIRFSSERKYSAVKVEVNNEIHTMYMGALSALFESVPKEVLKINEKFSKNGLRTISLGRSKSSNLYDSDGRPIIGNLELVALIAIEDEIRKNCKDTIDIFLDNGMDLKVISGDDPKTVDALFTIAKIPGRRKIISGDELDQLKGEEKTRAILETNIFGRMKPDHKEKIVETLRREGRYVAMVGDGVNDVKSLKMSNVGIALQSGSGAARGVADMVLVDDEFSALPQALIEGRRTVSGMRDILKLYISRNFALAFIVTFVMIIISAFLRDGATPFLPTQAAFYAFMSVSISALMMTLWAQPTKNKGAILPEVIKFAMPTGLLIAIFALIIYLTAYFATFNNTLTMLYTEKQLTFYGWPTFTEISEMNEFYGIMASGSIPMERIAEINARNCMLVFLLTAGIVQQFMVCPYIKFFSVDGKLHKDIRPTILFILLLTLIPIIYFAVEKSQKLQLWLPIMAPPPEFLAGILFCTVIWFFVNRTVLRLDLMKKLTNFIDRKYREKLIKIVEKNRSGKFDE